MNAILKPFGGSPIQGWEWDGTVFKPFGGSPIQGWEWDGTVFKPFGGSPIQGWEWDGTVFKPFGRSPMEGWDWDGTVFKPFGRSPMEGWDWDGTVFKPFGRSSMEGWEWDGEIPIFAVAYICILKNNDLINAPRSPAIKDVKESRRISKTRNSSKAHSQGEELGARLADYLIDAIGKIAVYVINYFKK